MYKCSIICVRHVSDPKLPSVACVTTLATDCSPANTWFSTCNGSYVDQTMHSEILSFFNQQAPQGMAPPSQKMNQSNLKRLHGFSQSV